MPHSRLSRFYVGTAISSLVAFAMFISTAHPALADVHFGNNVRIGGHDVSNQTFTKKRRGLYYIYNGTPPKSGCSWRNNGDGTKTKVCHLKRKQH